jgi:hypothetical protein
MSQKKETSIVKEILNSLFVVIISLGFVGIGIFVSKNYVLRVTNSTATTTAKVVETSINKSLSGGQTSYNPSIKYEYKVKDKTYTNNRIWAQGMNPAEYEPEAQEVIDTYGNTGEEITINYNPDKPNQSYIVANIPWRLFLVSLTAVGGGLLIAVLTIKSTFNKLT